MDITILRAAIRFWESEACAEGKIAGGSQSPMRPLEEPHHRRLELNGRASRRGQLGRSRKTIYW